MLLASLIVLLLAVSGPLLVSRAFEMSRARGAFFGAWWLLLAPFLAGMNFASAWALPWDHPLYSLATFLTLWLAVFFVGPRSVAWQWAARWRPFRLVGYKVRRSFHRQGLPLRLAGEVTAMLAAFLVLAPVSFFTLKPDPNYAYAAEVFERTVSRQTPNLAELVQAAINAAVLELGTAPVILDERAVAAAERAIAEESLRVQAQVDTARAEPARIAAERERFQAIGRMAREGLRGDAARASRGAAAEVARKALEAERAALSDGARNAMAEAAAAASARANRQIAAAPVKELRAITAKLVETHLAERVAAARTSADAAVRRILEGQRAAIEAAGRAASARVAEASVGRASSAMATFVADLRQKLIQEQEARLNAERKRIQDKLLAEEKEKQTPAAPVNSLTGVEVLKRTRLTGGQKLGSTEVMWIYECARVCRADSRCRAFTYQEARPHLCELFAGQTTTVGDDFVTSGRLP